MKTKKNRTSMGKIEVYFSKIELLRKYGKVKRKKCGIERCWKVYVES